MNRKTLIILISLSLLAGVGLAGGLYVISTPTNIAPKAASPASFPTIPPATMPAPSGPLTRQEIIDSFGQTNPRADQNADGLVNSLDLAAFDQKNK